MGYFLWIALFICLGFLVALQGEISRKKELLVKAMKGNDFQISLQIFCTALHKVLGNLLLKSAPLTGCAFLPWDEQNGLDIRHPLCGETQQPCSLLLILVVPRKATRTQTSQVLVPRASPLWLKSKELATACSPSFSPSTKHKHKHALQISNVWPLN